MSLLTAIAFLLLILCLMAWVLGSAYRINGREDEIHFAKTSDGYRIALYRYRPQTKIQNRQPVILCHGLAGNHHIMDFSERNSLAMYLADLGYDCWAVDLRGRGLSRPTRGRHMRFDFRFDDYLNYDLPALIKYVKQQTDSEQVHWVGHSMGGMLIYAYMATKGQSEISSVCALASPVYFNNTRLPKWLTRLVHGYLNVVPVSYIRQAARLLIPMAWLLPAERMGYNSTTWPRYLANVIPNVSNSVLEQFLDWVLNRSFCSRDHSTDYFSLLSKITRPLMVVVGHADWTASPSMCRAALDKTASPDQALHVLGKQLGQDQEYGHETLLLGQNAREEVYPLVAFWLDEHSLD